MVRKSHYVGASRMIQHHGPLPVAVSVGLSRNGSNIR